MAEARRRRARRQALVITGLQRVRLRAGIALRDVALGAGFGCTWKPRRQAAGGCRQAAVVGR
jgi:hypothetical protein